MKPKLKIAVVGLGRIGWGFHLMQSHRSLDFELTAAVDPLPDRLAEARDLAGCRTYRRLADMWKRENPDVVAIASPTRLHERSARRALREGAHVILEKPMTTNLASADRIIEEAETRLGEIRSR